jgi:hypothetical protein
MFIQYYSYPPRLSSEKGMQQTLTP